MWEKLCGIAFSHIFPDLNWYQISYSNATDLRLCISAVHEVLGIKFKGGRSRDP